MPEIDFSSINKDKKIDFTSIKKSSAVDFTNINKKKKESDNDVINNLPENLKFAFWDTPIPLNKEVAAGLVGMGDMMLDTYHGVKQMLGVDLESMRYEQSLMNDLYESDVGGYATAGAVAGALAEPIGFLIPAGKTGSITKAAVKGAGIGAGFGGVGYVDESKGQTRINNALLGATLGGGISGGIRAVGKGVSARKLAKANKTIDTVETRWAEKLVDGVEPSKITAEIKNEMPSVADDLLKATEIAKRKPKLSLVKEEAIDIVKGNKSVTKQNDLSLYLDKATGIVSTRIKNISEPLFGRLRQYDRNVMQKTHDLLNDSGEFLKGIDNIKGKDSDIAYRALQNGEIDTVRNILKRHGGDKLLTEYNKVTKLIDNLGDELVESGRISGKLENYFPRYVKDKDGLFEAIGKIEKSKIEKELERAIKKHGKLTPLQESDIINKAIRGFPVESGKPGFAKRRGIEKIDESLMKYYANPEESLHTYIRNAVTDLEKAKFFGKDIKYKNIEGLKEFDIDLSVGKVVGEELNKGNISRTELEEISGLFKVRFGIGEKSPAKITQDLKNIMYSGLLGNPISAATQIGDLGVSIYVNGFRNTLRALPKALIGKSKISATDMGLIDNMAEEFATTTKSAKALRTFFKYSGFKSIDKLGKETLLNGALTKYRKLSKSQKGREVIAKKYAKVFGKEYDQLVNDLNGGKVTENVKMMLFNELADVQPITLSEVPEMYLRLPNGRITYMLKTFMLKQLDILRRDAYQEIKAGNKALGLKNLMKYGIIIGSTNTGSQYIKDWMLGKDVEPDLPADIGNNFLKTFGYSEYMMNKVKDKKPIEAGMGVVLPPFQMFDKIIEGDAKAMQYMPIGGKMWYYWYGGGLEEFEQKKMDKEYKELYE